MAFDWNGYLTLAEELALNTSDEARLRSAISRSYYCAYNLAKSYLKKINPTVVPASSHRQLWNEFTGIADKINIQSWGDRSRAIRNKADYDDTINNLDRDVRMVLANVRYIIAELEKPPATTPVSVTAPASNP
jgi:hypothetical protein